MPALVKHTWVNLFDYLPVAEQCIEKFAACGPCVFLRQSTKRRLSLPLSMFTIFFHWEKDARLGFPTLRACASTAPWLMGGEILHCGNPNSLATLFDSMLSPNDS